jgi:hypothetical protein
MVQRPHFTLGAVFCWHKEKIDGQQGDNSNISGYLKRNIINFRGLES